MHDGRESLTEPAIKGSVVREFLLYYDRRYGHAATAQLVEGLPPHYASQIDVTQPALGILGASWYPVSLTNPMMTRAMAGWRYEGRELANECAADAVPRLISGVYRTLFDLTASPELYAKHLPRLWRRLNTTGERSLEIREPGVALSRVWNWPAHHPLGCWMAIYTMAHVFGAMGYTRWTVERRACVGHGGKVCETVLRYAMPTKA